MSLHRLTIGLFALVIAGCDDDRGDEHRLIGDVVVTVRGEGTISMHTWNASSSCVADPEAGAPETTCNFPIEDDGAEVVLTAIDAPGSITVEVTACGKRAADDSLEARGPALAFAPRDVLLGVGCPSYPVRVSFELGPPLPDDDAGADAAEDTPADAEPDAEQDALDDASDTGAAADSSTDSPG